MRALGICLAACFPLLECVSLSKSFGVRSGHMESANEPAVKLALARMTLSRKQESSTDASQSKEVLSHGVHEVGSLDGIPILTVDTRVAQRNFDIGSVVENLGFNETWEGKRAQTKNKKFLEYIDLHMDTPDKIVLMIDGGDVLFGGCDGSFLRSTYESIVKASGGAQIVLGGEFGCAPLETMKRVCFEHMNSHEPFESMRRSVLQELGHPVVNRSSDKAWSATSQPTFFNHFNKYEIVDDMYADRTVCNRKRSFCSSPPRYQFPNYGFIMGPVGELQPILESVNRVQRHAPDLIDQQVILGMYKAHPDKMTVDFSGSLMLSLHNFIGDVEGVIPDFLTIDNKTKRVFNAVTGKQQCFLHGNGRAKPLFNKLAEVLVDQSSYERTQA